MECTKGQVDCRTCAGQAVVVIPCEHCAGIKSHPCNGCLVGSYEAWERTAELLIERRESELAQDWIAEAQRRCDLRYAELRASIGAREVHNDDDELVDLSKELPLWDKEPLLEAVKEDLRDELRRLEKLLKRAKKHAT